MFNSKRINNLNISDDLLDIESKRSFLRCGIKCSILLPSPTEIKLYIYFTLATHRLTKRFRSEELS